MLTNTTQRIPPGKFGLPGIGETLQFLSDYDFQRKRIKQYGPIFRTHLFGRPTVVMAGSEANRFVLSTGMQYFSWREGLPGTYRILFGESLFAQDGAEARTKRRLLQPAFHRDALQTYIQTIETILVYYLKHWEETQIIAWRQEYKQFLFDVASTLLLGSEPGEQTARLSKLFDALADGFAALPIDLPGTRLHRALEARQALLAHVETAVKTRQRRPTRDALSLLIQSRDEDGNSLTLRELTEQALLLLLAGHDTTTSMATSFCLAMAQNPAVLKRARTEQDQLGGALTMESLRSMPYLEQILKEVERMYPPISSSFRGVVRPFEFAGYQIPQGWMLMYYIPHSHYDETIFPNPQVFDPDRFSPERAASIPPYSLIGFGGGPRMCLGYPFAQMTLKISGGASAARLSVGTAAQPELEADLRALAASGERPASQIYSLLGSDALLLRSASIFSGASPFISRSVTSLNAGSLMASSCPSWCIIWPTSRPSPPSSTDSISSDDILA